MSELIQSITELPVDEIDMGERLRPVSAAGVAALMSSIRDLGCIKDPIHVRKLKKDGRIVLMAGAHRLSAARALRDEGALGFDRIKVTCWRCSDDWARLMEIDDNLAGAELSPLDTAIFLARRKAVYERLHPEARAQVGAALAGRRWDAANIMFVASFADTVAQQMGLSPQHVRRLVRAGQALDARDIVDLRAAQKPVRVVDLLTFGKITDPVERYDTVARFATGKVTGAAEALRQVRAERTGAPPPLSDADTKMLRLRDAWSRAPKVAKRGFLEDCRAEIEQLLAELGEAGTQ